MRKKTIQKNHPLTSHNNGMLNRGWNSIKPLMMPLLLAIYPSLYHYANNAAIILLPSLVRMLVFFSIVALVIYCCVLIFKFHEPSKSANAAFIFLAIFNIYGIAYKYLLKLDIAQVEHYTLLPFFVLLAGYSSWLITKIRVDHSIQVWKNLTVIMSVLVLINIVKIIPAEIEKNEISKRNAPISVNENSSSDSGYPDIFYIIFDEFAGFESMREYWGYQEVDEFVNYLNDEGFFVAEESHGSSIDTLHQMVIRLNYKEYPLSSEYKANYFSDIADNQVMRDLKSLGYSTIVFDETNSGYPAKPSVLADYLYEPDSEIIPHVGMQSSALVNSGIYFDEFGEIVAENTMLLAISNVYKENNPLVMQHRDMIYFTADKIGNLEEIATPKFVYVHLLFPHYPFIFDQAGNITNSNAHYNWDYYLGNYQFSIQIVKIMVQNILSNADPERLPIIILQSDHGARNILVEKDGSSALQNYPEEFKTDIMFAMYLPGYDFSAIPQDVDPINTFPIVFNYLFDTEIPIK